MGLIDNLYIQKFHESRIEEFGSDNAKSLGWYSESDQLKRFDELLKIGDLNGASILDVGCGNGDLCMYLSEKYDHFTYHGIDLVEAFLETAVERNQANDSARFYLGDFMSSELPQVDYVLVSGSLNYKNTDPDFIFKAIAHLFSMCKVGLGFNLLSKTNDLGGILVAYSPEQIETYCRSLSSNVIVVGGIKEGEFTVLMYR